MIKRLTTLLLLIFPFTYTAFPQCQYGDPCMSIDTSCIDVSQYPNINEFVKAGVTGGIPNNLTVLDTLNTEDNIQAAIDAAGKSGGGVILLAAGVYEISSTIVLKSRVVLRGMDSDSVILSSTIRATASEEKKSTVAFNSVSYSGIENLTITFELADYDPIDKENYTDGGWCGDCFQNDPHGLDNLYVRHITIEKYSKNCWVDACKIIKSGSDPVYISGNHNTLRNCYIDRCYNKGGGGNGYIDIRGDYNLLVNDTIRRIRHLAIQKRAEYNVVINCRIEVDVNFHNGDDGNNLVEGNEIYLPTWHGWDIFSTGGIEWGHEPPGEGNIFLNNESNYINTGPRYAETDRIYTFTDYGSPEITDWDLPPCGTFYPLYKSTLFRY